MYVQNDVMNGGPIGDSDIQQHSNGYDNNMHSVRKFTWKELSKLNEPHNAHVAYRGKVSLYIYIDFTLIVWHT